MTTSLYEIIELLSSYMDDDSAVVDFVSYLCQTGKIKHSV